MRSSLSVSVRLVSLFVRLSLEYQYLFQAVSGMSILCMSSGSWACGGVHVVCLSVQEQSAFHYQQRIATYSLKDSE